MYTFLIEDGSQRLHLRSDVRPHLHQQLSPGQQPAQTSLRTPPSMDGLPMDEVRNGKRNFFRKTKTSFDRKRKRLENTSLSAESGKRVRVHRRRAEDQLRLELCQEQEPGQLQVDVYLQRLRFRSDSEQQRHRDLAGAVRHDRPSLEQPELEQLKRKRKQ